MGARAVLSACLVLALLAGCAETPRRFVLAGEAGGVPRLWPMPPEVPRYAWAGQLTGEDNFKREADAGEGLGRVWRWLAGIVAGEAAPLVLQRPSGGAVDAAGRVLVTDASRQAVFVFDPAAGELQVWERADARRAFRTPAGIAVGVDAVWVADADLGFVARLDAQGTPVARIGEGLLKRPTGLAWDAAARRLYVADTHGHRIQVFDADGRWLTSLGERGEAPGQFNYPTHLAVRGGELYVSDTLNSRVQVLPLDGGPARVIGRRGLYVGNLVRPKGVAVDGEGNIYVVESYYDHLLVFNRHGEFLMPIGGVGREEGKFFLPSGVWIDGHDRVFVADMFNGRVMVFQFLGGGSEGMN